MSKLKSTLSLFFITVIVIALLAFFGPEEKSLCSNVRIVYLHGAWVLAAELAFFVAGLAGLIALITRLGDISSPFALGNAIQLERVIPRRAALPLGIDLCRNRSLVAIGIVDD
jgi:hypothetical protein